MKAMKQLLVMGSVLSALSAQAGVLDCDISVTKAVQRKGQSKGWDTRQYQSYYAGGRANLGSRLPKEDLAGVHVKDYEMFTADGRRIITEFPLLDTAKEWDQALAFEAYAPTELKKGKFAVIETRQVGTDKSIWVTATVFQDTKPVVSISGPVSGSQNFLIGDAPEYSAISALNPGISERDALAMYPTGVVTSATMHCSVR